MFTIERRAGCQAGRGALPLNDSKEFVVETVLTQGDVLLEGPLGEFTGYDGRGRCPQPVMNILAVHHGESPIFAHALMVRYSSCEIGGYSRKGFRAVAMRLDLTHG
jgi:3-polyprenyl-4-hydroxybenzoate decarboxylase